MRLTATYYADEAVSLERGHHHRRQHDRDLLDRRYPVGARGSLGSFNLLENTELKSTSYWTAGNTPTAATISGFPDATVTKALKSSGTIRSAAKYTQTVEGQGRQGGRVLLRGLGEGGQRGAG